MARLASDLLKPTEPSRALTCLGVRPRAALESRRNTASGERRAISPKVFPLAADPSGASGIRRGPPGEMAVEAVGPDVLTRGISLCR